METFVEALFVVAGLLVASLMLLLMCVVAGLIKMTYDTFFGKDS